MTGYLPTPRQPRLRPVNRWLPRDNGGSPPSRSVRMVAEVRPEYPSDWPAICAVAGRLGIGSAETLRKWVRRAEVDAGQRPGVTSPTGNPGKGDYALL
jgi:hypothetical protein